MNTSGKTRALPSGVSISRRGWLSLLIAIALASNAYFFLALSHNGPHTTKLPVNAEKILSKCQALKMKPAPPPGFHQRTVSDRFQPGTPPVLVKNASIWTGRVNGYEVIKGDILLENGIIKGVGDVHHLATGYQDLVVKDVQGAWVTPGIIDVHSHMGDEPLPVLEGANDGNSLHGPILPWLRSMDGLNTRDDSYPLVVAGGLTTALILPGSANGIGGQAFVIKPRPTKERSPTAMLVEPPYGLNGSDVDESLPPRWRHMKHACGENPARVYPGSTRMDTVWAQRQAYEKARQIKEAQDEYCTKAEAGAWTGLGKFPEDLQWEALVDVLRGRVKVQTHCYEAVDFDRFISISNEFKFPVAAFHHAHEAYLVPEVLKRGYEHPPAVAMFALFSRYKRESFRASTFAARILAEENIKVVMKSDHPAIFSRYLLHEAQQAHYYGLPSNVALASVISTPAEVLGLDHRIGFIDRGYDADIVVWDSHPLSLGATPLQVYIDGIAQLENPTSELKPSEYQSIPPSPNFDKEAKETLAHDGLPPLNINNVTTKRVIFKNVSGLWVKDGYAVQELAQSGQAPLTVVVENGQITCTGECSSELMDKGSLTVDLEGGSIFPALVASATGLGLGEIALEASTGDGRIFDPLSVVTPEIVKGVVPRAMDGLQFGTRDALLAYRAGVGSAITAPLSGGWFSGISTYLSLGADSKASKGAVIQPFVAIHLNIKRGARASVSTQIAALRGLLYDALQIESSNDVSRQFQSAAKGEIPLVITVDNADIIATLLDLKAEVEGLSGGGTKVKMTLVGGAEAHLLAQQLAEADVGVILNPPRAYPGGWESRRVLPGVPLSNHSALSHLISKGVMVGIGPQGFPQVPEMSDWAVPNLRWDAGWAVAESYGKISVTQALALASTNVEKLLGVNPEAANQDLVVASGGGPLSFESKIVGMISSRRGLVEFF